MQAESERAADDQVLLMGIPAKSYAMHLLEVVKTIPGDQAFRPLTESQCPLVRRT